MRRLRVMGLADRLDQALDALQDLEVMHLAPPREGLGPLAASGDREAERQRLEALVADLDAVARLLGRRARDGPERVDRTGWPERARTLRADLEGLAERGQAIAEERALLERFRAVVKGFEPLVARAQSDPGSRAHYLVLRADPAPILAELRRSLGDGVDVVVADLAGGQHAMALLVPAHAAAKVDAVLRAASLDDLPAPEAYGGGTLMGALPRMLARLEALPAEQAAIDAARKALDEAHGSEVVAALASAHDRLGEIGALRHVAGTGRAFVIEGWVPDGMQERVVRHLEERVGPAIAVEPVGVEEWGEPAPVKLRNPPLFRPFEVLTSLVPLPAYGTLDPTPFMAVSFPILFGIILGDVGYGVMLALLALLLRWRSAPDTTARSLSAVAAASALFTVVFGVAYGEFFGDLGHRAWGWEPLLINREEALVPALLLALGVGFVHLFLGLVIGAVSAGRGHPRKALGRGLTAVMLLAVGLAALAVGGILPRAVFTPFIVVAVVAFPLMVVVEGVLAPIEVMSTLSHVLSYARIMAVGTASVLMAVVANRIAGSMGSALVGVLFALLFHVVNFAIGVFSPAVHVLRLHYVEFFGEFYSPGGVPYRPLGRWHPRPEGP